MPEKAKKGVNSLPGSGFPADDHQAVLAGVRRRDPWKRSGQTCSKALVLFQL